MRQVWETIAQFHMLEEQDRVLIGVSGGPDSVALLHLLHEKAEHYGIQLFVVHVHHMLRAAADEEAQYVETLSKQYGLPFRLYTIDVERYAKEHGMSLEQAGHEVRFQCFQDAKAYWGINKLALGHHRDDRAESVLMHIVQGCGLDGLTAMPPVDFWNQEDNSRLIRPLAQVSKKSLQEYCTAHQLRYFTDATNLEPHCLRNRIRLELLPKLETYNPQIAEAIVRMQDSCSADLDYMEQQVQLLWDTYGSMHEKAVQFPVAIFRAQHIALQRRLLRMMYRNRTGTLADLSFAQVEQMRAIAAQQGGTQQIVLANGELFVREYDTLQFMSQQNCAPEQTVYQWAIDTQGQLHTVYGQFTAEWGDNPSQQEFEGRNIVLADADCLEPVLMIRNRQAGDKLYMQHLSGHKTVKKYFIDCKVPQMEREQIPIVFSGDQIIWIPGYYIDSRIKITEKTTRICKLCFSK